ncbi:hypothetical protein SAMN05216354_0916 [Xylanibacter ruminicola]|uniref:Uncharacterized protein n=1 Tax=Xylanibacter ruminicola TaxID=839 RepID=A0A1H5T9W2_XYLRU|nr:hypothetical protein SAMN05216354_0916 [Xylanibacter ruminicola]
MVMINFLHLADINSLQLRSKSKLIVFFNQEKFVSSCFAEAK